MPELPEVEVAARRVRAAIEGRSIERLQLLHPSLARVMPPRDVGALVGRRVVAVRRVGKHQLLDLDDGSHLEVHFRMNGDWWIGSPRDPLPPHARAVLDLDRGTRVVLVDSRALATITRRVEPSRAVQQMGVDLTHPDADLAAAHATLATRRTPIKPLLLDQRVLAGVGNIYAAEALWRAQIDPRVPASSLGPRRRARLFDAVRDVMRDALRDPGRYQDDEALERFRVYDREGEPCTRCGTRIRRITQAGRSTYFCPRCQRR